MAGQVSVIIPVYNMEETIGKSIDSVLAQTWRDLELIVVDDGSTDRTPTIVDQAALRDGRVRVIHQPNGGVSRARNAGLRAARGAFVSWLDGDDWMHPEALERLMDAIDRNQADMAYCNYENVDRAGKAERRYAMGACEVITGQEALHRMICRTLTQSLCFNLAPRSFYRDIHFPEGLLFEDVRNSYKLYAQARRVAAVNDALLFKRLVREGSISHAPSIDMRVASCQAYLERQREIEPKWPECEALFVEKNHAMMLLLLRAAVFRDSRENYRRHAKAIREITAYFRCRTHLALGDHAGIGRRLEYCFLTSGTRLGFYLSRLVSLPAQGGTWLQR